ncbi:hypothetical protein [Archaeoglobus sp.]
MKEWVWKTGLLLLVATVIVGVVHGAPLDVKMRELINTTVNTTDVDQNGNVVVQYTTNVTGLINITNNAQETLYDIWVALNLANITGTPTVYYKPSYANVNIYSGTTNVPQKVLNSMPNSSQANYFIHITLLKPNDVVSVFYDVDDNAMGIANGAPFNVSEKFNTSKIPTDAINTWNVIMNVSVNSTWFANTALDFNQAEVNVTKYLSNDPNHYGNANWQLLYLSNVNAQDEAGSTLTPTTFNNPYDAVDNGQNDVFYVVDTLNNTNTWLNVTFDVTGQISGVSQLYALTNFGFATLQFDIIGNTNNTISGSHILDAFAVSDLNLSVNKSGPYQNATGQYALWIGNATFSNPTADLTYNVTSYYLWATNNSLYGIGTIITDENTTNQVIKTGNPYWILSPGSSDTTENLEFNYSQVPVIWANCTFTIIHDNTNGWWSYENTTQDNVNNPINNSSYIVIEKIYVIKSYLIKVTKHVLWNERAGAWDVYIVVENIGGMKSPEVYVYDLIPENYSMVNGDWDWTTLSDADWVNQSSMLIDWSNTTNLGVSPPPGYSEGYYWHLNSLEPNANGDGSYTDWNEIANNQSVVIHYQMNGTGEFHPIDAFVVGIDPMFSTDPQTAHKITIVSGAKATSYESLMALATGILGIVAMVSVRRR